MNHIIIEGFMGSGKGSISKRVATELDLPIIDVDKRISDRMKMTPAEIYDRFGDPYYRAEETFILSEIKTTEERSVIIVGSGLPTVPQSAAILKELGTVYYLKTDMSVIISRLDRGKKADWLEENADLKERVKKLLEEREPSYLAAADVVIEAKKRTVTDIVAEIVGKVREADGTGESAEEETAAEPETAETTENAAEQAEDLEPAEAAETIKAADPAQAAEAEKTAEAEITEETAKTEEPETSVTAEETAPPAEEEKPAEEKPKKTRTRKTASRKKKKETEDPEVKSAEAESPEPEKKPKKTTRKRKTKNENSEST
ncbi:MAG: hypothetical protein E7240_06485 [Lachnospiraceae bacterium]|nr:hypothetical protein [Lachnospiraceae bacterium]